MQGNRVKRKKKICKDGISKMEEDRVESSRSLRKKKEETQGFNYMTCPKCGMELVEIDYKGIKGIILRMRRNMA